MNWFRSECRRTRKLVRMAVAGCLAEVERERLMAHTGRCSECRYYAAELNILGQSLRTWPTAIPMPTVTPELAAQWHKAIQATRPPEAEAAVPAPSPVTPPTPWFGWDRAVPVSLVLIWLVTIGIHLNTPAIQPATAEAFVPTLREVRVVMEALVKPREAA